MDQEFDRLRVATVTGTSGSFTAVTKVVIDYPDMHEGQMATITGNVTLDKPVNRLDLLATESHLLLYISANGDRQIYNPVDGELLYGHTF